MALTVSNKYASFVDEFVSFAVRKGSKRATFYKKSIGYPGSAGRTILFWTREHTDDLRLQLRVV